MQDQVERILEKADADEQRPDDGISPIMPFPTSVAIDRDQEEAFVTHAFKRLEELERETGRDICIGEWWGEAQQRGMAYDSENRVRPERTWMGKRHLFDLIYKNDVEWRATLLGGIFADSNLAVPAARRICRQMIARAVNYFFGTDPWFAIYPVGAMDRVRADKADRYTRWKMDQAKLKRAEEMSVERAFICGESVAKITWATREQIYRTNATVLVDEAGNDILGADGDYIMQEDLWVLETVEDPMTGEVVTSDRFVLKRDGITGKPAVMIWQDKPISRRITTYNGPEARPIYFTDFLCPLEAESIQEADCVVHLYDEPLMVLADRWKKSIERSASPLQKEEATKRAIGMIRELAASSGAKRSGQNSDTVDNATQNVRIDQGSEPMVEIAEFHIRYDVDGDGILEDLMLIVDRNSRTPIFYDYEANVTPDGLRPFSTVRVNEVPGRWYGIGAMEMFFTSQIVIDLMVNRWNFANSRAARVDFWNPFNTLEGRANPNLDLNWGGTYTPAPGKTAKDCLESVYLENNTGEDLRSMAEFFMQLMTNESGVSTANDGQAAGLDSSKLATGIRNIEKSGQELFSLHLGHLEPGVSEILSKMVKLMMSRIDQMEVHRYFEDGEVDETGQTGEGSAGIQVINPGDLVNMELDTRILMTKYRGEQILESSIRAWDIVEKYYAQPSIDVQARTKNMAVDILKALQIPNADKVVEPLPMAMPPAGGPNINPTATAQAVAPKPRKSEPNL